MWVIRRKSDGWYYTGDKYGDAFHPDINQAQTYLAPPVSILPGVYAEEREPAGVSIPATLCLALLSWAGFYCLYLLGKLILACHTP